MMMRGKKNMKSLRVLNRFEIKITKGLADECWLWTSATTDGRYGVFWFNGGNVFAHRFAYELYVGVIPDGMCVCHHCDNGMCVNPSHLFLGTHKDNAADCAAKGRRKRNDGIFNPRAKLNPDDIKEIWNLWRTGMFHKDIAKRFGVGREAIGKVIRGERWAA